MKVTELELPGLKLIEPAVFGDERGFFKESFNEKRYCDVAGIEERFVQDNVSFSQKGVLRGLHLQKPNPQGKLVSVLLGEVFDVAVDVRLGSPTFGKWIGVLLSKDNHRQLYVPPGFAHGFCVTSETALFCYKCTDYYNPQAETSIIWNDPAIGIDWGISDPALSKKDAAGLLLKEVPEDKLVVYR